MHARRPLRGFAYAIAVGAAFGVVTATTAFLVRRGNVAGEGPPDTAATGQRAAAEQFPAAPAPARTTLTVSSTPTGLAVAVDGEYLDSPTPLSCEIEPGIHTITLADRGVELWRDKFQADADQTYTFHPVLESSGTPIVPSTAVARKRGEMPDRIGSGDIKAKLCIDRTGTVTSVELQEVPPEHARKIEKRLATWRYEPYRTNGALTAVCFAVSLALD